MLSSLHATRLPVVQHRLSSPVRPTGIKASPYGLAFLYHIIPYSSLNEARPEGRE